MTTQHIDINEEFKANRYLWIALMVGPLMMVAIFALVEDITFKGFGMNPFMLVTTVLALGCIAMSYIIYNNRQKEISGITGLRRKLDHYRSTFLVRATLLEGMSLVAIVFMFLEANWAYLLFAVVGLGILYTLQPSLDAFLAEYKLSVSEKLEYKEKMREDA